MAGWILEHRLRSRASVFERVGGGRRCRPAAQVVQRPHRFWVTPTRNFRRRWGPGRTLAYVAICTQCGRGNPDEARYCMACAAPLGVHPAARREERKVVSVLFCDLVGFTAITQASDPEDVSRMLGAYHAAVRGEIERFGGVVQKFIGDAVVAVWGAPTANEDDAERAVRAALAIVDAVDVEVRVGVNTGEVLVAVDETADLGASMVGDVVNTASRLQGVAPVGGVLAGEGTVRATRDAIAYQQLDAVQLKGKPQPVPIWRVVGAQPRTGVGLQRESTPFVGRERELRLLRDVFERVIEGSELQLVTVTGEPGIGKSRLVAEFERWLGGRQEQVVCRRGRCLAYGDGIGFWPLAEIVKQHLGLNETASEEEAQARLRFAVEEMADAPWIRARLAPLIGVPGESGEREETFTAWQRFLDEIAAQTPLVLVFEDLHWADSAMRAFIQRLVEWSTGVPILLVCTARPELFDEDPGWGGGTANTTTLALRRLGEEATSRLAQSLLGSAFASEGEQALIERCGGNPLYAEEYARLFVDRATQRLTDMSMPDTVHALIAARIDTLPANRKRLLQDAAVIGRVFWAGAVAKVSERDLAHVRSDLHEMGRKEFIRRSRTSSIPGDEEYVFWHDLVHEVAYGQIPRSRRGERHRRTAEWIEAVAGDRIADRAQLISHHYCLAFDLAPAPAGGADETLRRSAVRYLTIAGEQALGVDLGRAGRLLLDAQNRSLPNDPERAHILSLRSRCYTHAGDIEVARELLAEARGAAEERGDHTALAEAFAALGAAALIAGDRPQMESLFREAIEKLGGTEPTSDFADFLVWAGAANMLAGRDTDAERLLARALECARQVGDAAVEAMALNFYGTARIGSGDRACLEELEEGARRLESLGSYMASTGRMQVADGLLAFDGPVGAAPMFREAIDRGKAVRLDAHEMWSRAEYVWCLEDEGAWDEALLEADTVLMWSASHDSSQHAQLVAGHKARMLALRGDLSAAGGALEAVIERARLMTDPQVLAPTLTAAALVALLQGRSSEAKDLLAELGVAASHYWAPTAEICRVLVACDAIDTARAVVDRINHGPPRLLNAVPSAEGMISEALGDHAVGVHHYAEAIRRWQAYNHAYELGHALAGRARCLDALDAQHEAEGSRNAAVAIFRRLGVREYVWRGAEMPSSPSTAA